MDSPLIFILTKITSTEGFLIAIGCILVYFLIRHRFFQAITLLLSTAGLLLLTNLLKELIHATRPENPLIDVTGYGFPSGHATAASFLGLLLCYLAQNRRTHVRYLIYILSILGILTIGLSRIYFNVHTPFQVGAGYLLGALCLYTFIWINERQIKE